jgi:sec-independent protein translocase protein TatB
MFEISWSELLILGIVTLVFVGPKELPVFMRTLGRYASVVRRHANEFKAQFDAAMREADLEAMRKEVEEMQASINAEVMRAKTPFEEAAAAARIENRPTVVSGAVSEAAGEPETRPQPMPPMPAPQRMES